MSKPHKIGRNSECPCGTRLKYKHCCLNKVDWEKMHGTPLDSASRHLVLRGKNLAFVNRVAAALRLDTLIPHAPFKDLKRAFTPDAVRSIYESVPLIWPDLDDFERCVESESNTVAALYTGSYEPEDVLQAVVRLSLYCDKVYLMDPFLRHNLIRPEFNPLIHAEEHRATAIKHVFLWLSLLRWIQAGIVSFIRPIEDFVPNLYQEIHRIQKERFDNNPKLKAILEEEVSKRVKNINVRDNGMGEIALLSMPDEAIREWFNKVANRIPQGQPFQTVEQFIQYIHQRRDNHPYYVERLPGQTNEFYQQSSGASYELAKRMCAITNSHIVTDMRSRWMEIEFDRKEAGIDSEAWSPFAKALTNCELKVLNNVPVDAAFRLREECRLESMRLFMRKVWKSCKDPDEFSDKNSVGLAAELREEIAKAGEEWDKIKQELLKWLGGTGAVAGTIFSTGWVGFVPAASGAAVSGVTGLIQTAMKRKVFKERFPAGFFLGMKNE